MSYYIWSLHYDPSYIILLISVIVYHHIYTWWWCNSRLYSKIQLVERSVRNIIGNRMKQTTWNHLCLYMSHRVRERVHQEHQLNKKKKKTDDDDDDDDEVSLSIPIYWIIYSTHKRKGCVSLYDSRKEGKLYTHSRWCGDTANSNINSQGCEHNDIVRHSNVHI